VEQRAELAKVAAEGNDESAAEQDTIKDAANSCLKKIGDATDSDEEKAETDEKNDSDKEKITESVEGAEAKPTLWQ
ncbi:unnamed protein product, partial [Symbiodinium pilosum]